MDKLYNEDQYIHRIMDFLNKYGASSDGYSRKVIDDEIFYIIDNPGWSINRCNEIIFNLQEFIISEFSEDDEFSECFNGVNVFLK